MPEPGEEERDALGSLSSHEGVDPGARPTWRSGDAWRVQFDEGDPICWLVVADARDEGYRHGVWCPTDEAPLIAAQLATMGVAYAGNITPDLGGRQEDTIVDWFDWPLVDGKTWPTTWGGEPARVEAKWVAKSQRYTLDLCLDEGLCVASYDYDPALRWWSEIAFRGGFEFRVHERAEDWERGYVLGDAVPRASYEYAGGNVGMLPVGERAFEVGERDDVVVIEVAREGAHWHEISLVDPSESFVWTDSSTTLLDTREHVWDLVDASPGAWRINENTLAEGAIRVEVWTVAYSSA